jgi:hypothetical protein
VAYQEVQEQVEQMVQAELVAHQEQVVLQVVRELQVKTDNQMLYLTIKQKPHQRQETLALVISFGIIHPKQVRQALV